MEKAQTSDASQIVKKQISKLPQASSGRVFSEQRLKRRKWHHCERHCHLRHPVCRWKVTQCITDTELLLLLSLLLFLGSVNKLQNYKTPSWLWHLTRICLLKYGSRNLSRNQECQTGAKPFCTASVGWKPESAENSCNRNSLGSCGNNSSCWCHGGLVARITRENALV